MRARTTSEKIGHEFEEVWGGRKGRRKCDYIIISKILKKEYIKGRIKHERK